MIINQQVNSGDLRYAEDATRTILNQAVKKKYPTKQCINCLMIFQPKGSCAKFCPTCAPIQKSLRKAEATKRSRIKSGCKIGAGKGGANTSGTNDNQYKFGIRYFRKRRREILNERRFCERCNKDLQNATFGWWVVHHRDHNRKNNVDSNYELLCKRCHQLEHNCTANLPN